MKHEMFFPKGTVEGWRWCDWVTAEPDWFCISLALILLVNLFRTDSQFSNLMQNKWPNLTLGYPTQLLKVWESEGIENTEIVQAGCVLREWEQRHRVKWSEKRKKKNLAGQLPTCQHFPPQRIQQMALQPHPAAFESDLCVDRTFRGFPSLSSSWESQA